jgi:Mg/Co/Ni transporter MgtE
VGAFGIALSLFCIVTLSTVAGTAMPFALAATGQDPANAGTTIQVFMDVMGVVITCVVCSAVFTQFPEVLTAVGG